MTRSTSHVLRMPHTRPTISSPIPSPAACPSFRPEQVLHTCGFTFSSSGVTIVIPKPVEIWKGSLPLTVLLWIICKISSAVLESSVVASWVGFEMCKLTKMWVPFSPVICSYRVSMRSVVNNLHKNWISFRSEFEWLTNSQTQYICTDEYPILHVFWRFFKIFKNKWQQNFNFTKRGHSLWPHPYNYWTAALLHFNWELVCLHLLFLVCGQLHKYL